MGLSVRQSAIADQTELNQTLTWVVMTFSADSHHGLNVLNLTDSGVLTLPLTLPLG